MNESSAEVKIYSPGLKKALVWALGGAAGALQVAQLSTLKQLTCYGRQVHYIKGIEYCENIISLNLHNNDLRDISPLSGLKKLQSLDIGNNSIEDISPLVELRSISRLYIGKNKVRSINCLEYLTNLKFLYLSNNQIEDLFPLVNNLKNGGLKEGSIVYVSQNPLNRESVRSHMPYLKKHGVKISYRHA